MFPGRRREKKCARLPHTHAHIQCITLPSTRSRGALHAQVRLLLEHGANVNCVTSEHFSPLYIACQEGYADCAKALLAAGADVDTEAVLKYAKQLSYGAFAPPAFLLRGRPRRHVEAW